MPGRVTLSLGLNVSVIFIFQKYKKFLRVGPYTNNDPCYPAHFQHTPMHMTTPVQPTAQPIAAPIAHALLTTAQAPVVAAAALRDKSTSAITNYKLTCQLPDGTTRDYILSTLSWDAIQRDPALKLQVQLETRRMTDKKGRAFTRSFAYVAGFSTVTEEARQW
jgi:hypothetical protein